MAYTERGNHIRIITARRAMPQEVRTMSQDQNMTVEDEMRPEYDFSGGTRGTKHRKGGRNKGQTTVYMV